LIFWTLKISLAGLPADLKNQGNLIFFQGQGILKIGQCKIKIRKSQGKIILKDTFFSIASIGYGSLLALNISLTSILL